MIEKIVVSDLDGTLLNEESEVSNFSKEVILKFTQNGGKFYIATGRAYPDAKRIIGEIGIKVPVITANGAVINDENGTEIYRNDLEKMVSDDVLEIDYLEVSEKIHMNIYSNNKWYVEDPIRQVNPFEDEPHFRFEVLTREEISEISITKFFFIGHHKDLLKLERIILDKLEDKVNVAFTHPECLEIFDIEVTKANAIKKLSIIEKFDIRDVVAFGDGFNDYEMLQSVGKGYVMGNAHYKLKEALPHNEIIETNHEDGVAKKIIEIFS